MNHHHIGTTVGVGKCCRDRHYAAQCGIRGLELEILDYPLARHQLDETAVVSVGSGG